MEEKNKKHKLTYEQLETVAKNLGEQNAILYKKLQESSLENAFKRIEFLFKVLNFNSLFEPTFVKSCIEEIQNTELDQHMHGNFEFIESEGVTESYKCMYQIQSGEVELRHIFSDYSGII